LERLLVTVHVRGVGCGAQWSAAQHMFNAYHHAAWMRRLLCGRHVIPTLLVLLVVAMVLLLLLLHELIGIRGEAPVLRVVCHDV